MKLLGIAGKKRSGKDTVASIIFEQYPNVQVMAFATRMKDICASTFGVPIALFYDQSVKEIKISGWKMSPREMMTTMDGAIKGTYGADFFVRVIQQEYERLNALDYPDSPNILIITDVRFDAEAEWLKSVGGKIIQVTRPTDEKTDHSTHWSETGFNKKHIDYVINNDSSLDNLQNNIYKLLKSAIL
jgi:hypothetical protein